MANKKYIDVDVLAILEEKMKSNTKHYQSDFELDKRLIAHCVDSPLRKDKIILWLSRTHGTACHIEHDAFIRDTAAHNTWRYYAEQMRGEPIIACAIELTSQKDGVIRGNVYELDYLALAERIKVKSVPLLEFKRTFQDGYVTYVAPDRSCAAFYRDLVAKHGEIIATKCIPTDPERLNTVLLAEKAMRDRLALGIAPVDLNASIQQWYQTSYPDDNLGSIIRPDATFAGLYQAMNQGGSVYDFLGQEIDTVIRERVFSQLAILQGVDYMDIYNLWLHPPKPSLANQIGAATAKKSSANHTHSAPEQGTDISH